MRPFTRREFLACMAAFAVMGFKRTEPELILYNGNIITVDDSFPRAQAVAIAHGRFLAVGATKELLPLATVRTKKINLDGKTVVPGFIDAHTHPCFSGRRHLREVDCDLRAIADIQTAIRQRAAQLPPGSWVLGFKYDDSLAHSSRS